VNRVLEVFSGPAEDLWLFEEQVRRWAALDLGATQRRGVQALRAKVERLREATTAVLALAAQLREGTIERVLAKVTSSWAWTLCWTSAAGSPDCAREAGAPLTTALRQVSGVPRSASSTAHASAACAPWRPLRPRLRSASSE
jgi:hypothetical protein